jgi:hypothetical protein
VRRALPLALLAWLAAAPAQACTVSASEWARPRSAQRVLELPGVRECVASWRTAPDQRLVLVHAPGEEGALWAAELRDWLIALGVPGAQLDLRAVGSDRSRIELHVEAPLLP